MKYSSRTTIQQSVPPNTHMHNVVRVNKTPVGNLISPNRHYRKTLSNKTLHVILTVFSNLFSSFLHSTCSLSVSQTYLALGESHLPLRFALPNKSTLMRWRTGYRKKSTGLSPSMALDSSRFFSLLTLPIASTTLQRG